MALELTCWPDERKEGEACKVKSDCRETWSQISELMEKKATEGFEAMEDIKKCFGAFLCVCVRKIGPELTSVANLPLFV